MILSWPIPKSATETQGFLGLVRYIAVFLPSLANHLGILTNLTMKDSEKNFPPWAPKYQIAFDAIKAIVTSQECLTTIDFTKMPDYRIFVTTDASDRRSGAVLSFGRTWESARPVAFNSMTFKGAELNYPVHEKELLAAIHALKKWQVDLLGSSFFIYTDHKTLENFNSQKDLSHRQSRWMELMSQFNAKIIYIKGEDNCVADALSQLPDMDLSSVEQKARHPYTFCEDDDAECTIASIVLPRAYGPWGTAKALAEVTLPLPTVNATLKISADKAFLEAVKAGYADDEWCKTLPNVTISWPGLVL